MLWRYAADSPIYRSWSQSAPSHWRLHVLEDYHDGLPDNELDVLVTHMHYRWDELTILRQSVQEQKTAVLVLADGILEFRNTWHNPRIPAGSMMQPAVAHKIATIGPAQARLLESWGNQGKCEVVGLPRLDQLVRTHGWHPEPRLSDPTSETASPDSLRLLVCSATTPAFDDQQWEVVQQAYRDLHQEIQTWNQHANRLFDVRWRVADAIRQSLDLPVDHETNSLHEAIEQADAVVTSPSTIQLEAMVCRKPTVLLDYFPVPKYVPAAWTIACRQQIPTVLQTLVEGSAARSQFQDLLVRDQLWVSSSAADRLLGLISQMGSHALAARRSQKPLTLPPKILTETTDRQPTPSHESRGYLTSFSGIEGDDQLEVWLQQNLAQAAIHRAKAASSDRAELVRLDEEIRTQKDNYQSIINEKQNIIEELTEQLADASQRHEVLGRTLETRNREFDQVQQKIVQLSEARKSDHQMLSEAHADARQKQERVNQLRERCQNLVERHDHQQQRASHLAEHNQNLSQQLEALQQRSQELMASNQELAGRIEELVEERKTLYARLKKARG